VTTYLLDVNVLIALVDPAHVQHDQAALRALPGHTFWPDSLSIAEAEFIASAMLSSHARVTDSYLLALAHANRGRLATLDHKLATEAVPGAKAALALI
jgi:uncharacterized protein